MVDQAGVILTTKDENLKHKGIDNNKKLDTKGTSTCAIMLENCKLPKENILRQLGLVEKLCVDTKKIFILVFHPW